MSDSVNENLRNRAIRHAAMIERLRVHESRRIIRFLNSEVFPDLVARTESRLRQIRSRGFDRGPWTTKRFQVIQQMIRETMDQAAKTMAADTAGVMRDAAKAEVAWQAQAITSAVPIEIELAMPSSHQLRVLATEPVRGRLLKEWYDQLASGTVERIESELRIGLASGETVPQMVRRIRGTRANGFTDGVIQATRQHAESVVRTSMTHVTARAREILYSENSEVIKGVQWVATLDSRTTPICASLDGQVFKVADGPRPPAHVRCRSTTIPVMKSWEELGIPAKDLPPSTRASMNGQVAADITYEDWLRTQPRMVQEEVLGKTKAKLWNEGKISGFRALISQSLRPLSLQEIARAEGFTL